MPSAAIYARVSTDEQVREGYSLAEQVRLGRERATSDGLEVSDEFVDAGISGSRNDRPEYVRLLAAATEGTFSTLYVWKFDRLGRDAEELLRARRMLEVAGVRLVSLTEGEAEGTLVYGVRALIAQEEREKVAERTRAGLSAVARSGRQPCGQPPLGYRAVGEKRERRLVIDRQEAEIVRRIFAAYIGGGGGVNTIVAKLNADGLRTRRGKKFSARVVLDMLGNATYIGRVRLKGEEFEGSHEAILDAGTWDAAQRLRSARRSAPGGGRGRGPAGRHLFVKGLLRCGECGRAMSPRTRGHSEFYVCVRRHTYNDCPMPYISRRKVDEAFLAFFEDISLDMEGTVAAFEQEARASVDEARARAARAEADALRVSGELERIRSDYRAGKMPIEEWHEFRDELKTEIEAARREQDRAERRAAEIEAEVAALNARSEVAERLSEIRQAVAGKVASADGVEALRAAFARVFERVDLELKDGRMRMFPIPYFDDEGAGIGHPVTVAFAGYPRSMDERALAQSETKARERSFDWASALLEPIAVRQV